MPQSDVIVVGAGVIGLTCALELAKAGQRVRIVAEHTGRDTTSYAAGAMVSPAFGANDERLDAWCASTRTAMLELADDPATGVRVVPTLLASRLELPVPAEANQLDDLQICGPANLPPGFAMGMRTRLPMVAMPTYLDWLTDQLRAHDVEVERRHLDDFGELTDIASTVINSTGVGARDLVPDDQVTPDRGQHVVVRNPGVEECFYEVSFDGRWAGWMVHDDVVVLGGVSGPDDHRREPDPAIAAGIIERCAAIEPRFATAEVLEHRVGLRPARPSVRLEAQDRAPGRVVHCYGHGGMGVALSYGCALDVVGLVTA